MSLAHRRLTPAEYLELERKADYKSEFYNGETFAMSGTNEWHDLIKGNLDFELRIQLRGRQCRVHTSDIRVKVSATGLYTYPDISALCGEARFEDERRDTLLNPSVIVEVLSKTTEGYDRGAKFAHYQNIETVTDYVLIAQDRIRLEHYMRQPDGPWLYVVKSDPEDKLALASIGVEVPLKDIFAGVRLPDGPPPLH